MLCATAAAGGNGPGSVTAEGVVQAGNPLAIAYLTIENGTPVEQIEAAAAAGFDALGLRLLAPQGLRLAHDIVGNDALIREIRRACQRTGVSVLDVDVFTIAPSTDIKSLERAIATAAALGASIVQTVCDDPDAQRATQTFAALCAAAAGYSLIVAIEFMRWREVRTLEDALALVTGAGSPNAAICVDTLHLSRSGGTPAALAAVPPAFIPYVQLCDAPSKQPALDALLHEARRDRLYPGEGELWLDEVLDVMPSGIPISIEVPRIVHATRNVRQRAKLAGDALRGYLEHYRNRASPSAT
jgi:sugar phosphate isomerase/epimerase